MPGTPPVLTDLIENLETLYIDAYTVAPSPTPLPPQMWDRVGGLIGDRAPIEPSEYYEKLLQLDEANVPNEWFKISSRLVQFAGSMVKFGEAREGWIRVDLPRGAGESSEEAKTWQAMARSTGV